MEKHLNWKQLVRGGNLAPTPFIPPGLADVERRSQEPHKVQFTVGAQCQPARTARESRAQS